MGDTDSDTGSASSAAETRTYTFGDYRIVGSAVDMRETIQDDHRGEVWHAPVTHTDDLRRSWEVLLPGQRSPMVPPDWTPDPKDVYNWGVALDVSVQAIMRVNSINPVGLISMWNRLHPDHAILVGDWIVNINDQDDIGEMLQSIKHRYNWPMIWLTVTRPNHAMNTS